ncbi:MAG: helix-turn-helix domain-containing protein [Eubacterium sp.]|nr:helix-turn-helix domain-containing protein [Eubacterium sp.]
MNIYLGENLKKLRTERNMTQEALADFLGVSFQAISKWERNENFPDIETLVNLAQFFNTSVDDLIGVNRAENEERLQAMINEYDNYLNDNERKNELILKMIDDYPNDFRVQLRYMAYLFHFKGTENVLKINSIYNNIMQNCTNDRIRMSAKRHLAMFYKTLAYYGDSGITYDDVVKIIEEMPAMRDSKEYVYSYLYPYDRPDSKEYSRNSIEEELCCLYHGLYHYILFNNIYALPTKLVIDTNEKMIDIANYFYNDGNYGKMWRIIMDTYCRLGCAYFENGNMSKAIENLKKSAQLAKQFDEMDRITVMHSDFFDGREFDKHTLGSTFIASSRIKGLMTERYPLSDEFKSSPEFAEILEILG